MQKKIGRCILIAIFGFGAGLPAMQAFELPQGPLLQMEFTNAKLQPSHWMITLHSDGTGEFESDGGTLSDSEANRMNVGDIHRPIQLSEAFTAKAFATARSRKLFAFPCESRMKVAYQGTKHFTYTGPEGTGNCEYNYSKDKEIQALGDSFLAIESTVLYGARLEKLLQHDRLGLDQELESLVSAAHDGNALEMGAIADTLTKIASDEQVLDRARRKARLLLSTSQGQL